MTALHQEAVDFIQCAVSQDTCGNSVSNQEIAMFLIGLVENHKRQLNAAAGKEVKTGRTAAGESGAGLALVP